MCYLQLQKKPRLRYTVAYSEDISSYAKDRIILCHCPDARSLKLNKPFLSREKRVLGTSQNCCHWWNFIKVNAWIKLLDLFCLLWMHPALPHRVKHFYKQLEGRMLLSGTFLEELLCYRLDVSSTFMPTISEAATLQSETLWFYWNVLEYDSWPLGIESSGHCLKALKVLTFLH